MWQDTAMVEYYLGQFAPRRDAYVQNSAAVVKQELTPDVVRRALQHNYSVSAYMADEGRTHVGAIDFDRTDGFDLAMRVARLLEEHGSPSLIVGSRRGAHLWVTCEEIIEAGVMHRALAEVLALTEDGLADDHKVEVFPKYGEGFAVGALRLPGLPHQKTQIVYPAYTIKGEEIVNGVEGMLEAHDLTPAAVLRRLSGNGHAPCGYPKGLDRFYGYTAPAAFSEAPSASEVLIGMGVERARPGATVRCPRHDDKHGSLTIFRDDERVYCGAPHCELNNSGHGVGSVILQRMARA